MIRKMFVLACLLAFAIPGTISLVATESSEAPSLKGLSPFQTLLLKNPYRVDLYIAAAAELQKLGKDRAIEILRREAAEPDQVDRQSVIVLCRMLFAHKPDKEFRRPMLGAPYFLGQAPLEACLLEPIELVDGIPFLITSGYGLAGLPESSAQYLEYCLKECDWSMVEFKPKSEAEGTAKTDSIFQVEGTARGLREGVSLTADRAAGSDRKAILTQIGCNIQ